jgi:tetratricopeptide (TPR) repeat protein
MADEKLRQRELLLFRLTMWAIVACSFIALVTKVLFKKPSVVPVHYLLISAALASLLAVLVPNLESYIFSKISEINIGGVKLVIAQAKASYEWLKYEEISPEAASRLSRHAPGSHPFPVTPLFGFQLYQYERLSYRLYQSFDEIKDPNDLDVAAGEDYRAFISRVGRAAFAMKHLTKYLDIVLHLQLFRDRELDSEELFLLGHAYLCAAGEQLEGSKIKGYQEKSVPLLKAAMDKNPYEVKIPFNLGVALLSLENYQGGIDLMQTSIGLDKQITPWAKWNIACGLKKLNRDRETLEKLGEIPPGPWWEDIAVDGWFADPGNPGFRDAFELLCLTKKSESEAGKP